MTNPVNVRGHRTSRRIRWLWRTFEQLRCHLALQLAADDCQQTGSSALATAASVLVVHSRQVLPGGSCPVLRAGPSTGRR